MNIRYSIVFWNRDNFFVDLNMFQEYKIISCRKELEALSGKARVGLFLERDLVW
jgi:hypothetical protein